MNGPIRPLGVTDMPPERALAMHPCIDLDLFVFVRILGMDDPIKAGVASSLPALSSAMPGAYMLLIKSIMELGAMKIDMGPKFFMDAVKAGHMIRKKACPVWRVEAGGLVGYGRCFPEALCKLLIVDKFKLGRA